MSFDNRVGLAGLIVAFFGIAAMYLWPDKRWIGWLCLCVGAVLLTGWVVLEVKQKLGDTRLSLGLAIAVGALVGGGASALIWHNSRAEEVPRPGMRLRRLEFTIPKVGEQMWAIALWENTSDENIVAHGGATVYTMGLSEIEKAPITRATEDAFEAYGWGEYQKLDSSYKATEIDPHAQVVTRHQSDPRNPMTQLEIDEMTNRRARTYVVGGQRWTINGEIHGCDFCAWTSGNGIAVMGYQHNRCF